MGITRPRYRRLTAVVTAALLALGLTVATAPGAVGQVPVAEANFSAYATGTVVHADALALFGDIGDTRVANVDAASSSAIVDSTGISGTRSNEMGLLVQPDVDGVSYGRGSAAEVGIGTETPDGEGTIILPDVAEATAPPTDGPNRESLIPAHAGPLLHADVLAAEAFADWGGDTCLLGSDMSYGAGLATNLQVLDLGGGDETGLEEPLLHVTADDPDRSTVWTTSRNFLGPQVDADHDLIGENAGVFAEVRQTIAPVSLFGGTLTIEVLGEWVLRAAAGGVPGSAHIHYGPGEVSPDTPVLRVFQDGDLLGQLVFQDILGGAGLEIPLQADLENILLNVAIAEAPRALGGPFGSEPAVAGDGTSASAAVDVVRVTLLELGGLGRAAQVRVGHMEVEATAPPGGVLCEVPVSKVADPPVVSQDEEFVYSIRVDNPFACELRNVRVVDDISGDDGVSWTVLDTDPPADSVSDSQIVWNDIGPIPPGESRTVHIRVEIDPDTGPGQMFDEARVTAVCVDLDLEGTDDALAGIEIPVTGEVRVVTPEVRVDAITPPMPITGGGSAAALLGLALAGAALAAMRRRVSS